MRRLLFAALLATICPTAPTFRLPVVSSTPALIFSIAAALATITSSSGALARFGPSHGTGEVKVRQLADIKLHPGRKDHRGACTDNQQNSPPPRHNRTSLLALKGSA